MLTVVASAPQEGCDCMDQMFFCLGKKDYCSLETCIDGCEFFNGKGGCWEDTEEATQPSAFDTVNHPKHYESGKYECIDVMAEAIGLEDTKGFCLCNAFKYIYRCTKKHNTPVEDVQKAIWYLQKFLELEGELDD